MQHGVKRFIFISSIGVLGRSSDFTPFTDDSPPNPQVPYAQAKWEAEQALLALPTTMDRIIIRPPLVYGPGVKGNFALMLRLINKQLPLPFGAVKNRRQLIGIDNLIDFIQTCIKHEPSINNTFLVADQHVLSTTQLLRDLSVILKKKNRLIPVPQQILQWGFHAIGKASMAEQLLGNMEIDTTRAKTLLGWTPPYTMREQLIPEEI
jgi:nucleoside-diphosphate-sugar epimerase